MEIKVRFKKEVNDFKIGEESYVLEKEAEILILEGLAEYVKEINKDFEELPLDIKKAIKEIESDGGEVISVTIPKEVQENTKRAMDNFTNKMHLAQQFY